MLRFVFALALVGCAPTHDSASTIDVHTDGVWASADRTAPSRLSIVDSRHPLSSAVMIEDRLGTALYSVDSEHGTLVRFDRTTLETETIEIGAGASRVSRAGDDLFVSVRGERRVVKLLADGSRIEMHVGAEPIGILARPDGDRVYVAVSQENVVLELNGETLALLARIPVRAEPRFLALHPGGQSLFIGSARGPNGLDRLDLESLAVQPIALPAKDRVANVVPLLPRLTGDFAVRASGISAEGVTLAVPVLYTDVETPIPEFGSLEEADDAVAGGFADADSGLRLGGYGGASPTPGMDNDAVEAGRLVPAVVEVEVDPSARAVGSMAYPVAVAYSRDGQTVQRASSFITSVAYHGDHELAVTLEADDAIVVLDKRHAIDNGFAVPLDHGGFASRAAAVGWAGDAVGGAVWTSDDQLYSVGIHDHSLASHPVQRFRMVIDQHASSARNDADVGIDVGFRSELAPVDLDPALAAGRELFFSADDPEVGGGGVSCSTCHFDGRDDGMTWAFESGHRQTPSLAGVVSATAPVTWVSAVRSVAEEARITSMARMGGAGLDEDQALLVERFIDSTPIPDRPDVRDTAAIERGRVVFAQLGCGACHTGDAFTDGAHHTFNGELGTNTPTLVGIAATAPYLSDGSAPTLGKLLVKIRRSGVMGSTAGATDAELADLEAYLRSL